MNPLDLEDYKKSHRLVPQNRKLLYQITKMCHVKTSIAATTKIVAHATRKKNNDLMKLLIFHTVKNKKIGKKLSSIRERAITLSGRVTCNFLKILF